MSFSFFFFLLRSHFRNLMMCCSFFMGLMNSVVSISDIYIFGIKLVR